MRYLSKDPRLLTRATTDAGKAGILKDMIRQYLLADGMRREGVVPVGPGQKPSQDDYVRGYQLLMQKHFPMPPAPSEEEAYEYYQQHREQYGIPETVRVSQIQFRVPRNATQAERDAARARAEAALKRLEAGEPFAKLAGEVTENPRAKVTHGDLGFLPVNQDPWLAKAVKGLKVGERTGVLGSPSGFEILALTDHREALIAPFPNVRDRVISEIRLERQNQARDAYLRQVAKEVGVTIEMAELKDAML
jgi:parvulin-like peptidyl-prolyl isomerase